MNDIAAYDNRYNIISLVLCIYKRGSPEIIDAIKWDFFEEIKSLNFEKDAQKFEKEYDKIKKEFYSPKEILKRIKLI
jgi:hypothetical protein